MVSWGATRRLRLAGVLLAAAGFALAPGPKPVLAQGLGIPEYRRLIGERETEIARLVTRLEALESRADSLSQVKRRTEPGSAQFEHISNEILKSSQDITEVARRLRLLNEQLRDLKTNLFIAYNAVIPETQKQIDDLTQRGRTTENSRELRRLVARLEEDLRARERLAGEIEEVHDNLFLLELTYDPRDGPAQLRVKEAIARDAVDKIGERILVIEDQITKALEKKRDLEEFQRLQRDIELWGDVRAAAGGSEIEAILQNRTAGGRTDLFENTDLRIRDLHSRRLELLDRRTDYETKARLFAQRLQEFYP